MVRRIGEWAYETHSIGPESANKFIPCGAGIGKHNDTSYKIPREFKLLLANTIWLVCSQCDSVHVLQGLLGV
jgi:hypothetical protein